MWWSPGCSPDNIYDKHNFEAPILARITMVVIQYMNPESSHTSDVPDALQTKGQSLLCSGWFVPFHLSGCWFCWFLLSMLGPWAATVEVCDILYYFRAWGLSLHDLCRTSPAVVKLSSQQDASSVWQCAITNKQAVLDPTWLLSALALQTIMRLGEVMKHSCHLPLGRAWNRNHRVLLQSFWTCPG